MKFIGHRYLRLLPTVSFSVLLAYVVLACGWNANEIVYDIKQMDFLMTAFPIENLSGLNAIYDAFIGTFIHTTNYVAPLWTIPYEFVLAQLFLN